MDTRQACEWGFGKNRPLKLWQWYKHELLVYCRMTVKSETWNCACIRPFLVNLVTNHACVYTHTHFHIHSVHGFISVHGCVHVHMCVHVCVCAWVCVHDRVNLSILACTCMMVCVCACVLFLCINVCMCLCVCMCVTHMHVRCVSAECTHKHMHAFGICTMGTSDLPDMYTWGPRLRLYISGM